MKTFQPPAQERSRQTYQALIEATRAILAERSYEETTLRDIADRAGVTVGAFYARFGGKEALLEHLEQRTYEVTRASFERAVEENRSRPLDEALSAYVRVVAELYAAERGVIRALVFRSRVDASMRERRRQFNTTLLELVEADLLTRSEIAHPRPAEALRLGWLFVTAALRELVLFGDYFPGAPEGESGVLDELGRAFRAYLGSGGPNPGDTR